MQYKKEDTPVCIKLGTSVDAKRMGSPAQCLRAFIHMSMSFSELLKNWRKEEGITQADAVELSGIKAYGNLERGKDVKLFPLDLQTLYSVVMPEEMSFGAFVELWANSTSERESS